MKSVVLRGPVLTQSGYGVHCRQVARWLLNRKDINVKFIATPWGDTPWLINPDAYEGFIGQIMSRSVDPSMVKNNDLSIQLQLPNEWDPTFSKVNVGITAAVETDRCNPQWVSACNAMDMVIVPSQHAKANILNSGAVAKPLHVIPESFSDSIKNVSFSELNKLPTSFNFLVFGQLTGNNPENDRKNVFYTIKWLCDVFKGDKDVGVILKTNAGRNSKIDRMFITNLLKQVINEAKGGVASGLKFYLLHGDMTDDEVASLYRSDQVKALISLTRGEGYGLPILEAAASGLPIIATNWSGHLDFLNKGKFISIDYKLTPVHPSRIDNAIFVPGMRWASPSEEDFKKRVQKFRGSNSTPKEWALDLQKKILTDYDFSRISTMYDETVGKLLEQ